ncbi:DUF4625 domain-containing protein [Neptunitalea lumnitzerae]|uniref:DUF4625 domain-containing protein n=1 Tax=Neptunitalea lumnitzerae TaxID=2965509 RepID=A0ABQ5MIJ0_9FLAO|nr:DUF4625 domain-containing protein [Neptunitalea sp. Y10]GLB49121.1 hypothetical protein Y10_14890 [Neptunitalea sp. Y10]
MLLNKLFQKASLTVCCTAILVVGSISSCSNDSSEDNDLTRPTISLDYNNGFPQSCAQLQRGETYTFKAMVSDNDELASYSLDIHNNFDHHTHDDQGVQCDLDAVKSAVNPFIYMENFTIESGLSSYEIEITLTIPEAIDTGDYHCAYSVTDITGWQSRTSVDIKIIE